MKRLLLLAVAALSLTGCPSNKATETPQSIAAKTLLSSRQAVIAGATTVDTLCKQHVVKPEDCATAALYYDQAQTAYGVASDAFVLAVKTGASSDWTVYLTKEASYKELAASAIACYSSFQGGAK